MDNEELLLAEVELSKEARAFLDSSLGQVFMGRTKQDIEAAKDELLDLDPCKFATLQELQNKIISIQAKARQAQTLIAYFSETIVDGNRAIQQLEQPEDTE